MRVSASPSHSKDARNSNCQRRRRQPLPFIVVEHSNGTLTIPTRAYHAIRERLPAWFVFPHLTHITTDCPTRRRVKTDLQTFVRDCGDTVELKSRAAHQIIDCLHSAGNRVSLQRPELPAVLRESDPTAKYRLQPRTEQTQQIYRRFRFGQFVLATPGDVTIFAADFALAFPRSPILFPVATVEAAERFADILRRLVREPVQLARGITARPEALLIVCTYGASKSLDLMDCPMVVFPLWPDGFQEWMKSAMRNPSCERMYLLRAASDRVNRRDEQELLHRVGPVIARIDPKEPKVQHSYSTVRFGGAGSCDRFRRSEPLDKQSMYWHQTARNRLIAALARRIATSKIDQVANYTEQPREFVLVETPVHGRLLASELPGWPLVTHNSAPGEFSDRLILTLSAAAQRRDLRLTCLINAMGGPPSDWLEEWLTSQAVAGHAVHVVDLTDEFCRSAAVAARARQRGLHRAHAHRRRLPGQLLKPVLDDLRNSCRS